MDTRDMKAIRDTIRLDNALQRVKPRPKPSWIERHGMFCLKFLFAAVAWWIAIWLIGSAIEKAAFDAVNGIMGQ